MSCISSQLRLLGFLFLLYCFYIVLPRVQFSNFNNDVVLMKRKKQILFTFLFFCQRHRTAGHDVHFWQIYACKYIIACIGNYLCIRTYTHIHIYICNLCINIYIYIYVHIYVYIHIYIYIYNSYIYRYIDR